MNSKTNDRRGFLHGMLAAGSLAAAAPVARGRNRRAARAPRATWRSCPPIRARRITRSLKQSSYDRTGGNRDSWPIAPGGVQEVFNATGRRRDHAHLVHDRGAEQRSLEGTGAARLLGRQRQAQRGSAGGRFLRAEPGALPDLRIAVSGVLAGPLAELLFRHAVQAVGAIHGDQRGLAAGGQPSTRTSTI